MLLKSLVKYCNKIGIDICIPRISSRQAHRSNIATNNPESYYRVTIFIPFLDNFIGQLHDRFLSHENILSSFTCLFLNSDFKISNDIEESFKLLSEIYKDIIYENNLGDIGEYSRNAELQLLQNCFKHQSDIIQIKKMLQTCTFSVILKYTQSFQNCCKYLLLYQ